MQVEASAETASGARQSGGFACRQQCLLSGIGKADFNGRD